MRILLTADPEIPVPPVLYGGIERIVDALVNGYLDKGHDVTLLAHPDSKVRCRMVPWKGKSSNGLKDTARNTATLFTEAVRGRYEIIHSFSRLGYLTPLLPLSVPKIMSYQREPTLSQISRAMKLARKGTLRFTGCSAYIADQIKPIAPAHAIYNCVPMEQYDFCETVAEDAPLAFLGRIEPIKGTHVAVEVARRSGRRLRIAGNIPAEGKVYFEEKIAPFLDDRIQYIGPVNDKQKNEMLCQSAAFLMPIQWKEPFGIVMAEAMACGTPVLGFSYGAVPEVVVEGVTGFLCADADEMVRRVEDVRLLNRRLVWEKCKERFASGVITDNYLELYRKATNKGAAPAAIREKHNANA